MTVLSLLKKQRRLKLLMLWLGIAFGHLGHTSSHYFHIGLHQPATSHDETANERSDDVEHTGAGTCVTCIAFALVFLELARSTEQSKRPTHLEAPVSKSKHAINLGMEIALRPGQPRAPPAAA